MGLNHIALEVGDIDEALGFYRRFLEFELRGRGPGMAFIELGDQFLALAETTGRSTDAHRHFGLVVDDQTTALRALDTAGIARRKNRVRDPWGNTIEIVGYPDIQFTKADHVLRGMGLGDVAKTAAAEEELAAKNMSPER